MVANYCVTRSNLQPQLMLIKTNNYDSTNANLNCFATYKIISYICSPRTPLGIYPNIRAPSFNYGGVFFIYSESI